MSLPFHSSLMYFYGAFLITCGIVSVIFIGMKAKTALASGGTSGIIAILIGYFSTTYAQQALIAGMILSLALFIVFSWRSTKTLFKIFELLTSSGQTEVNKKGIAFLIISLMAVVSIVVLLLQIVNA